MGFPATMKAARTRAFKDGVTYGYWEEGDDQICLICLQRDGNGYLKPPSPEGKGKGRKHLEALLRQADKHKLKVRLWTNVPKLMTMYYELGFVTYDARYVNVRMLRHPRS